MGRATVNRKVQIGLETTAGNAAVANRLLPSLSIDLGPKFTSKEYRAAGFKYNTTSRIHQAWAEGPVSGPLDYEQLYYALYSLIGAPTTTTPGGGSISRQHVFSPNPNSADAFKTLTVEQGDADAAEIAAYCVIRELGFEWGLDDVTMTGSAIARLPTVGSLTATPTAVPQVPVSAREIDVFIDPTTYGNIGTTKVTDALSSSFKIGNKFVPKWVLNTANASFKDVTEVPVDLDLSFITEHNAQSRALFATIANNPIQFVRVLATGPIIEGAIPYKIQVDVACHIAGVEQPDVEGVWGYEYSAKPFSDVTMARPFQITLVNTRTAF